MAIGFGLYPGSACGDDAGHIVSGRPDDRSQILRALDALEADARSPLLVRAYTKFSDERGPDATDILTPPDALDLAVGGRTLDLVAQYQSRAADVDGYALFYSGLILAATAAVALISSGYVERVDERPDEYYVLLLLAALGSMVLVSAVHFVSFFLGLELLSVLIVEYLVGETQVIGIGSAFAVVLLVISLVPIVIYLSRTFRNQE